ncbi:MAG: hypothetical protein JNN30_10890 [Rhodanobacteraceae bacterium]|nr:hypothetical protein [Rhodanobacteraceae bacterium]
MLLIRYGLTQARAESTVLDREIRSVDSQIVEIAGIDKSRAELLVRKQIVEYLSEIQAATARPLVALGHLPVGVQVLKLRYDGRKLDLEALCRDPALLPPILAELAEIGLSNARVISREPDGNGNRIRVTIDARPPSRTESDLDDNNAGLLPGYPMIARQTVVQQP